MRNPRLLIISLVVSLAGGTALAGCSTGVAAPSPTPTEETTPTPTPTALPVALPTVEAMLASLDTGPNDEREPTTRLGVVLEPDQPQFLEDARAEPFGPGTVRVACASEDGSNVTVTLTMPGVAPVSFDAPCGTAPNTVTSQELSFDFTAAYRFDVASAVRSVVAVGVIPNAPQ